MLHGQDKHANGNQGNAPNALCADLVGAVKKKRYDNDHEDRRGPGDGVEDGQVSSLVGVGQSEDVDGLKNTCCDKQEPYGDGECGDCRAEQDECGKEAQSPQCVDQEEEGGGRMFPLAQQVPAHMREGGDEDEDDGGEGQGDIFRMMESRGYLTTKKTGRVHMIVVLHFITCF